MVAAGQVQLFSLQLALEVLWFVYSWCLRSEMEEDRSTEGQLGEPVYFLGLL